MNSFFAKERSKWLLVIFLFSVAVGYAFNDLFQSFNHSCAIQEVSHNYNPHPCKASEEPGCRG
tara:strand:+ start:1851 stop:2039 length:189 start_codon:yes stop_codon:yes gene_type:complete